MPRKIDISQDCAATSLFRRRPRGHWQDLARGRPCGFAAGAGPRRAAGLSRPAVEAGERLGFLPGDMKDKVDPYLRPIYDALYDFMEGRVVERGIQTGMIEIAPLAFMRGRTLSKAAILLDEAQNATAMQMKMFLTRLGEGSRMMVNGDPTQTDLGPARSPGSARPSTCSRPRPRRPCPLPTRRRRPARTCAADRRGLRERAAEAVAVARSGAQMSLKVEFVETFASLARRLARAHARKTAISPACRGGVSFDAGAELCVHLITMRKSAPQRAMAG